MIFALYVKRAGAEIDFVVDINPAKQGKFVPGSGLHVISPDEALAALQPGTDMFVMNSNYLEEIMLQSGNRFNYFAVDHCEF